MIFLATVSSAISFTKKMLKMQKNRDIMILILTSPISKLYEIEKISNFALFWTQRISHKLKNLLLYIRIKDWWNYIIPPILSFYFIGLLVSNNKTLISIIYDFTSVLFLSTFVASFGFFLNEWSDIKDDAIAKKPNQLSSLSNKHKWTILLLLLVGIYITLSITGRDNVLILFLCLIQIGLLILYSVMPFRLKRNKYAAIIIDALYSGTLFYIIAANIGSSKNIPFQLIMLIFIWAIIKGIRNIIHHLIQDKKHDEVLNLQTLATTTEIHSLKKIILYFLLPTEIISYLFILYNIPYNKIFIAYFLLYCIYILYRKNYVIPFVLKREIPLGQNNLTEINLFYERYFPFIVLIALIYNNYRIILLLLLYIIVFYLDAFIRKKQG